MRINFDVETINQILRLAQFLVSNFHVIWLIIILLLYVNKCNADKIEINEFLFVTNSMNEKAHDTSQKFQHNKTE